MFKSSAIKVFFISLATLTAACSWRNANENTPPPASEIIGERQSAIPFETREPEIYQTEIAIKSGENERKIFTARNGGRRLTVFDKGEKGEFSRLENVGSSSLLSYPAQKVYAEDATGTNIFTDDSGDFLTNEWLNQKTSASFEKLGAENNLTKFRVRFGDAENQISEAMIYVDENLRLPVRQEFYSLRDNQRTLNFSVELKDFKSSADENLFQPPAGFRKIPQAEFQKILRREKLK